MNKIKLLLYRACPKMIYDQYIWWKKVRPICSELRKKNKKHSACYIMIATPTHGNMGDQAIVYAQRKMLEKKELGERIIEFTNEQYLAYKQQIAQYVTEKDVIVIDGGGNMGSIWPENELKMQDILMRFQNNRVIVFPNTMYYSDDLASMELLQKSKEIYNAHPKLTLVARDYSSYLMMKEYYNNAEILYSPDIVLSLKQFDFQNVSRKGIMTCFRQDREKSMSFAHSDVLKAIGNNSRIVSGNTVKEIGVTIKNREQAVEDTMLEFASFELVITDRLHAMIFCAITGTPCIAIDNVTQKISGVYSWIIHLPYVKMVQSISELEHAISELYGKAGEYVMTPKMVRAFEKIEALLV